MNDENNADMLYPAATPITNMHHMLDTLMTDLIQFMAVVAASGMDVEKVEAVYQPENQNFEFYLGTRPRTELPADETFDPRGDA